jgi:hypothetical protein
MVMRIVSFVLAAMFLSVLAMPASATTFPCCKVCCHGTSCIMEPVAANTCHKTPCS